MNYNINSSGVYNVNSYNLTSNKATVLSTLNVGGNIIASSVYSSGYVGIGTTATSVLELFNINYPTYKLKFGGYFAPNKYIVLVHHIHIQLQIL